MRTRIDEIEAALRGGNDEPTVTSEEVLALIECYRVLVVLANCGSRLTIHHKHDEDMRSALAAVAAL